MVKFPAFPFPLNSPDDDKPQEECGVFGIFSDPDAAAHTALGLHALQHRGQEAAGVVSCDGENFHTHKGLGHVHRVFRPEAGIPGLPGTMAIGHVRYSTSGDTALRNVQPLYADLACGGIALAHNGNLTNALTLRHQLVQQGCIFQSTSDTEVIIQLMARSRKASVEDRLIDALSQVEGAFSLVVMTADTLIGVRDPHGFRPLVLGSHGDATLFASETCALDIISAEYVRDIEPGEMVVINRAGLRSMRPFPTVGRRFCIFEYIYFARPDSVCEGLSVYDMRKKIGMELAREAPVTADVVVPVPDSGIPAALGYAQESGIPFELGIIRNHYVGRTFIQPTQKTRDIGVRRKHNANRLYLEGKRVVLVDDSIVRGTTSTKIVDMVRQAGAAEVHLRISSPPTAHPCYFGIDTPEREKLLASRFDVPGMARILGVDSLAFISVDGLYRAAGQPGRNEQNPGFCDACFTGDYVSKLTDLATPDTLRVVSRLNEHRRSI
ncbi:amidophosphoribosyltransferase [Haematospirillum jordaniae]|uniref:Amidophosphoribosyltransferase n=1 Tax=Haematospirillum jordaniae TaxID=1549855 RepID=A0A143DFQ2_9PROT|nr:amidophosphoribosyltransferase [Haematospirillum jordaniae]AMW35582.1 amidophosphoribosyltransferase [Haematospirillum jordaniae]NKD45479.1 amidophosphoribosyltransferase [Haematospirillum jordaniae]NKD56864.1 amidophosphoribosyltransferase [Haematospirillum jordaniae]NKD58980.1 amidophosphoribosyltransferase [Haematospirillum jordaniae]NKD66789.1 amidophosphoribosyltransferase [Haematospirillum jordaniae]